MQSGFIFKWKRKNGFATCVRNLDFAILRGVVGVLRYQDEITQNADCFRARGIQIGQIHSDAIPGDLVPLPAIEIILVH
jgi:hypothetical protein